MPKYHEEDPFDLLAAVSDDVAGVGGEGIRLIDVDQVTEHSPYQTRVDLFDPARYPEDKDLARSIVEAGKLLPHLAVVVAESPNGLTLLAGHRRYYALRWLLTTPAEEIQQTLELEAFQRPSRQVPAYLIENPDPRTVFEITIVENLHRRDLRFSELAVQIAKYHQTLPRGAQGKAHRTFGLKQAMYYRYLQVGRKLLAEGYEALAQEDKRHLLGVSGALLTQWVKDYPHIPLQELLPMVRSGQWPPQRRAEREAKQETPAPTPPPPQPAAPLPPASSPAATSAPTSAPAPSPAQPRESSTPTASPAPSQNEREATLAAFAQANPWARRFDREKVLQALEEAKGQPAWVIGWLLIAWALGTDPKQWPPKRARIGIENLLEHLSTKSPLW